MIRTLAVPLRLLALLVFATLGACTHYGPPDWPQDIGGRPIRDGGSVWIYARSAGSADEVAGLVRSLGGSAAAGDQKAPRGVIIVTEAGETPPEITSIQGGAAGMVKDLAAQIPEPRLRRRLEDNSDALVALVAVSASGRSLRGATALPAPLRQQAAFVVSVPSEDAVVRVFRAATSAVLEESGLPFLERQLLSRTMQMGRDEFVMRVRDTHEGVLRGALAAPNPVSPGEN